MSILQIGYTDTNIHYNIGTALITGASFKKDLDFIINITQKPFPILIVLLNKLMIDVN